MIYMLIVCQVFEVPFSWRYFEYYMYTYLYHNSIDKSVLTVSHLNRHNNELVNNLIYHTHHCSLHSHRPHYLVTALLFSDDFVEQHDAVLCHYNTKQNNSMLNHILFKVIYTTSLVIFIFFRLFKILTSKDTTL